MLLGMNETSVLAMNEWIVYSFFFSIGSQDNQDILEK